MKKLISLIIAGLFAAPAFAAPITMFDGFVVQAGKVGLKSDKVEFRSSGGSGKMTLKYADSSGNSPIITVPSSASNDEAVLKAATQTLTGKTLTSPTITSPTITGGLPASQIQTGSAKRQMATWQVNGAAGSVIADGATYKGFIPFGRAGTVTRVNCLCATAPVGGTSTIKFLKASGSGNTMLSAASLDPTTLADNVITSPALTATSANLGLTATQGVYVEWVAGTQSTDGVNCSLSVEYEPTDF